jgi:hypothetical protein
MAARTTQRAAALGDKAGAILETDELPDRTVIGPAEALTLQRRRP